MHVKLHRTAQSDKGTFGVLSVDGFPLCVTCELPWHNNSRSISCIPAGTYQVAPHIGTRYKNVWQLLNVPDRTAILIHEGNTIRDINGCILVGQNFGTLRGLPAVLNSKATLEMLKTRLPNHFTLEIIDA